MFTTDHSYDVRLLDSHLGMVFPIVSLRFLDGPIGNLERAVFLFGLAHKKLLKGLVMVIIEADEDSRFSHFCSPSKRRDR